MSEPRNPLDPVLDEVEERTFVIERPRPAVEPFPDFEERTIVVGRAIDAADGEVDELDRTVVVGAADEFDRTVVVGRADRNADAGVAAAGAADEFDRTVVVGRENRADADDDERTLVRGEGPRSADATVRSGKTPRPARTRGRRRTLTPAPLDPATLRPSVPGRGAGAVEAYPTRQVPSRIAPMPVVMDTTPPSRDLAAKPSVARRARRDAAAGLVAVGASVVVSVGGLIALALVIPSL